MGTQAAAEIAHIFTLWRCFWCGTDYIGPQAASMLAIHTSIEHAGRDAKFTIYPPAMGLEQLGGGRDA